MTKKINLAVIFGGPSGEHEVSLKSAKEVINNLDVKKYQIIKIKISKSKKVDLNFLKKQKIDIALIMGHGTFMEDGRMQAILEAFNIPYVFSGVLASALAMNKYRTKILAKNAGLNVAKSLLLKKGDKINYLDIVKKVGSKIVIKPNELGSSVGMSIVKNEKDFNVAIKKALKWDDELLFEEFVSGRELTVPVIELQNMEVLPITEIKPIISEWFDFEAKYQEGGSEEVCPALIPGSIKNKIKKYAVSIFKEVGCKDLARADFIWETNKNKIFFLEINTIPGMTKTSIVPESLRKAGYNIGEVLDVLIKRNLKKS